MGDLFIAVLNFIKRQIGVRGDTAAQTGSVMAMLKYITGKSFVSNGSSIKSIQRGTITLSTSQTSNTATISSVDTSKARVNYLGVRSAGAYEQYSDSTLAWAYAKTGHQFATLQLSNGTTVTATREQANSTSLVVAFEVIEEY